LAKRACEANGWEDPATIEVLAAAQAESGQFEQASATAQDARELANAQGQFGLANAIQRRLELYDRNQPFRD
jgi:predicted nucleic acid-binding Zn finger protein